ncbi:hypothetical protein GIB67_012640 [Kingdonia uniflora]|uniref:LOB domain-containing protein n=1 Tax=Kingdonia uniflora TaxID=39325 RepID=A0A7J7NF97_9MAGN|nr:hypothetical protein GIB67_012640 [Kingdonia uniflora]
MRMSCNGCRVLRKGCNENCSIRPCLQWIKTPESQANATVFLAKFYGRAGLMNLINSGPDHLRPAIFRSLLYEACGRIVNPIYGSVGLLWSGSWQLCQAAVEAVLKGAPIAQIPIDAAAVSGGAGGGPCPPLKSYDIRHVAKDEGSAASASQELHKVRTRSRFKRSAKPKGSESGQVWGNAYLEEFKRDVSHEACSSQQTEPSRTESMFSVETVEASLVGRADHETVPNFDGQNGDSGIELELTLSFEPVSHVSRVAHPPLPKKKTEMVQLDTDTCKTELGLD